MKKKKWYGNLSNRIDEGQFYGEDKTIREGTDITMYHWSDRSCFFVTKVVDQKHIFVKQYSVCADHSKDHTHGHQNWLFFKVIKDANIYLNTVNTKKYDVDKISKEPEPDELVFRYNSWKLAARWTLDKYNYMKENYPYTIFLAKLSDKDIKKLESGKEVVKYTNLPGPISFGIRDFYHDWSF